jgi:Tfp pilus assembly protein PilV
MRSTRTGQRGSSLVESVVASALLGIGVVAGLTAWDTASMSAARAVRLAWANCIVRADMNAILSAPYASGYVPPSPFAADGTVQVSVTTPPSRSADQEQQVSVQAYDPRENSRLLASATALKSKALQGSKQYDGTVVGPSGDVMLTCPAR